LSKGTSTFILDDSSLSAEQRKDLQAFLKGRDEVSSLGAYIPVLHASATEVAKAIGGAMTTIYVFVPKHVRDAGFDIVKGLISEWSKRYIPSKETQPEIEYVTLFDYDGRPAVKVALPPTRIRKLKN
jgi:hypothetical protein